MSYLWYDPSAYQKPTTPRKVVTAQEGDEKVVEVVGVKNANEWGRTGIRKGVVAAKFGEWFSHVRSDIEHFVDGGEDENIQIAGPSNFHQVSHVGWDPKKVASFR